MIKSLEIQNYQSHKKTKLEFSPGVNVIIGATDSGKSAIIKALRWAITNRPTGDSFRSTWGGETGVKIEMGKDFVCRVKTDKSNEYSCGEINEDVEVFKAFKTDVPEEIEKALDLNHINIQTQFESHFLLSKSAGEVASHFNKVAHLDKIDVGLQNIQRWLKKLQQDIVYNEVQVEELTEQLSDYDDLEEIEELVVQLEKLDTKVEETHNKSLKLIDTGILINEVNVKITKTEKIVSKGLLVDKALVIVEEIKVQETLQDRLSKGIRIITEVEESIKELEELLPFEKMVNRALEIDEEIRLVGHNNFVQIVGRIGEVLTNIEYKTKTVKKLETRLKDNMDICPLCETVLK